MGGGRLLTREYAQYGQVVLYWMDIRLLAIQDSCKEAIIWATWQKHYIELVLH